MKKENDELRKWVEYSVILNQQFKKDEILSKMNLLISEDKIDSLDNILSGMNIPYVKESAKNIIEYGYRKFENNIYFNDLFVNLLNQTQGDFEKARKGAIILTDIQKARPEIKNMICYLLDRIELPVEYNNNLYKFDTSNLSIFLSRDYIPMEDFTPNESMIMRRVNKVL